VVCIPLISSTGHGHASLKRIHYQEGKFALGNLLIAALVKDRSLLSPEYLSRYLNFTKDRLIVPLMTGVANMSLNLDRLATVPIEFPSLPEQERVVNHLHDAEELVRLRDKADQRASALIPALFHKVFGDSESNPKGWTILTLEEISDGIVDGPFGSNLKRSDYVNKGVPVLQGKNITGNRFQWFDIRFISHEKAEELKRSEVRVGDHLLIKIGSIGYSAIVDELNGHGFAIIPANMARIRPKTTMIDGAFLHSFLTSPQTTEIFKSRASQTAQPALSLRTIKAVNIPVPPLPLQKDFAQRVAEISAIEAGQAANRLRLENLFQSLLYRAFEGEL